MRRHGTSGNMVLEAALWIPVLVLLLVGTLQFGKITYTYFALRKAVFSAARYLAVQQGVNFCDLADDPNAQNALNFALYDPTSGAQLINGLTPSNLVISTECVDPASGAVGACDTSGCGAAAGAQRPDYIIVSVTGFLYQMRFPGYTPDPTPLSPSVTVSFGGSSL
jgi:Flp pilus assembly protein TadG